MKLRDLIRNLGSVYFLESPTRRNAGEMLKRAKEARELKGTPLILDFGIIKHVWDYRENEQGQGRLIAVTEKRARRTYRNPSAGFFAADTSSGDYLAEKITETYDAEGRIEEIYVEKYDQDRNSKGGERIKFNPSTLLGRLIGEREVLRYAWKESLK